MVVLIFCFLVSLFFYYELPLHLGYKYLLTIVFIILLVEIYTVLYRKESYILIQKQYLRIFPLLLFSFICVHFQQFIDILFGYDSFHHPIYNNQIIVLKAAFLSLIALSSILIGYRCYDYRCKLYLIDKNINTCNKLRPILNWLFLCFTILFIIINGKLYLTGNYSQEMMKGMQGSINAYSIVLLESCMYLTVIETCKYLSNRTTISIFSYIRGFPFTFYLCLIAILFLNLYLGDRGPIITYLSIYVFGYIITSKRKFNISTILIVGIFSAIFLSVIAIYRTDENKTIYNFHNYHNVVYGRNSISPFTAELAGSTYPTLLAIESTPDYFPYRYGLFSLNNLLSAIPFSSTILKFLGINYTLPYNHSSSFITWYGHDGNMNRSGLGSSTVADVYLDFGPIGVILILFLLGCFIRHLEVNVFLNNKISNISDFILIAAFVMFSNAIYFPRSMVFFFVKDIVWTWLFYRGVCFLSKVK